MNNANLASSMLGPHPSPVGQATLWLIHFILLCTMMALLWSTVKKPFGRQMGLFIAYGATAISGRILMEGAPNIQPVTILMLLAGAHLGSRHGVALAVLVTLVSNIFLGSGWWTIWQASGWAMVAVSGALASNWLIADGRLNMWRVASLGLAWGFLFDWWVSMYIFHGGADMMTYFQYLINGISFDLLHAAGNITFAFWLVPALNRFPEMNVTKLITSEPALTPA